MNSTLTGAVAIYLAQVRAELSDLPPGELEDVLEDVSGHLTEVAAEFEGSPPSRPCRSVWARHRSTPTNCGPQPATHPDPAGRGRISTPAARRCAGD